MVVSVFQFIQHETININIRLLDRKYEVILGISLLMGSCIAEMLIFSDLIYILGYINSNSNVGNLT